MSPSLSVFDTPALPLLLQLEADGFTFATRGERLLVRPVERLTPELRRQLEVERERLLLLLRICDDGVQARREAFACAIAATGPGVLPLLVFRAGVPYAPGICFSCGEANDRAGFGRCPRCALAWRLAAGVAIPADSAAASDVAKQVA